MRPLVNLALGGEEIGGRSKALLQADENALSSFASAKSKC